MYSHVVRSSADNDCGKNISNCNKVIVRGTVQTTAVEPYLTVIWLMVGGLDLTALWEPTVIK